MNTYFPVIGSRWKHHSNDIIYTVSAIANIPETSDYPMSVVYVGPNGKIWVNTLQRFLTTMIALD